MGTNQQIETGKTLYGDEFYEDQLRLSYLTAQIFTKHLWALYQPASVIDFGCGRGPWLKAFKELGATDLIGLDGPWNRQENMVDQAIRFIPTDLNAAVENGLGLGKADLAMTVEVVEHLQPERSAMAVNALSELSDVIMFGAAFLHQPGTDHINTHLHSFWAELFAQKGYHVYDFFRPTMWGLADIPYWYQQNTFLYVHKGHPLEHKLAAAGYAPMERFSLMDQVHPELLSHIAWEADMMKMRRTLPARVRGRLLNAYRKVTGLGKPAEAH